MSISHSFIFQPGTWLGDGTINFSISPDTTRFFTKWVFESGVLEKEIAGMQSVEIPENQTTPMQNFFVFKPTSDTSFLISIENELVGTVSGKGIVDEKTIAWEIRGEEGFEGFEVYERQGEDEYILHAEYASLPHIRTIIDGHIWKKSK